MGGNEAVNSIDLLDGALEGGLAGDGSRRPDSEENGAEAAFAEARDIDRAFVVAHGDVEILVVDEALGSVDVGVDHQGIEMQIASLGRNLQMGSGVRDQSQLLSRWRI